MTAADDRLAAVLDALGDLAFGVVEIADGRIVDADERFCELIGYSLAELRGLGDLTALLLPGRRATGVDLTRIAEAGESDLPTNGVLLRRDGTPVEVWATARRLDAGDGQRLLVLVRDAREESRQSEQLAAYAHLLQRMPLAMLLWRVDDPDDPTSIRLVDANRAATAGAALRRDDIIGRTIDVVYPGAMGLARGRAILEAHRTREIRDLGQTDVVDVDGPFGPGTYRRAVVPLPGDMVASLVENVTARRDAEDQRRSLLRRVVEAGDEERKRIAVGLHDDAIQALAAAALEIGSLRLHAAPTAADDALARVEDELRRTIGTLRRLIFDLTPPELDDGLAAAVEVSADHHFAGTGTTVRMTADLAEEPDAGTAVGVYRIVAEALTNAYRHAAAGVVEVALRSDGRVLSGVVRDDGRGAASLDGGPGHLGMRTMRERAAMLGGRCTVTSTPGHGTLVEFTVPVRGDAGGGSS